MKKTEETLTKENVLELLKEVQMDLKKTDYLLKEILTFKEASEFLSLSKSALYKLTSKREIPFYSPGGKLIYFRKSELEYWVFSGKVTTNADFDREVETYLSNTTTELDVLCNLSI
jgi:excisionase family DNA binding protein